MLSIIFLDDTERFASGFTSGRAPNDSEGCSVIKASSALSFVPTTPEEQNYWGLGSRFLRLHGRTSLNAPLFLRFDLFGWRS